MGKPVLYPDGREHLSVVLPSTLKDALRQAAKDDHRSVSQVVTLILRAYFEQDGQKGA
ncbi:hypothetical protein LCGC14_2497650 [marine sediment metagenome]|uniref:Uncharacterized protein n=1 Tax=marine sediment metagenome TaxID=412755 RepID=A0A0F9DER3_9ZZZZ